MGDEASGPFRLPRRLATERLAAGVGRKAPLGALWSDIVVAMNAMERGGGERERTGMAGGRKREA